MPQFWAIGGIFISVASPPALADINPSCHGGTTTVCGVPFALPTTTRVGDTATIPIPSYVLGTSFAANSGSMSNSDFSFAVKCVSDNNGGVSYQNVDVEKVPCNLFPCLPSTVALCGISIPVAGGTPIGGTIHMTMPVPFVQNSFTVQCTGTGDKLASYEITDSSAISCDHLQP